MAVAGAAELAAPAGTLPLAALDALVAAAFALGAAAAVRASPPVAALAFAVGAAWVAGTVAGLGTGVGYLTDVAVLLHRAPLALLILIYPGRRPYDIMTRVLALGALLAPFAPGNGGPRATAVVACLVALAASLRTVRASSATRPPHAAAGTAGAAVAIAAVFGAAGVGDSTHVLVVYEIVLLGTAVVLLAPPAWRRWEAAAASGLVVELGTAPAGAPVTARLAEALHDPGLELRLRLPGGPWTDEAGRPARAPDAPGARQSITSRVLDDGTEVALLHDPAAVPNRAVAESAVAVAATAIDVARRGQEVGARIEELRRLRRGLLDAADEERRQLEVELRSGPLHDLDELDHLLRRIPPAQADALRSELAIARQDLVAIAHGLHPEALIERGLTGALSDVAASLPLPVVFESTLGDAKIPLRAALAAYYVVNEALANVAKHASARRARVDLSIESRTLTLRIEDDGVGGADAAGNGLRGLRDRVEALDGTLRVSSPPSAGTVVEALLPLDPK